MRCCALGGHWQQLARLRVVAHAFEPVLLHQALQRLGRAVQAQHRAQGALCQRLAHVLRVAHANVGGLPLHQRPVQFGHQRAQQVRVAELRVGQQGDVDVVRGHGERLAHQLASPNTPPRISTAITKCCCSTGGTWSFSSQLSSRV